MAVVIYPSVLDCDSSINASNKTTAIDLHPARITAYCHIGSVRPTRKRSSFSRRGRSSRRNKLS